MSRLKWLVIGLLVVCLAAVPVLASCQKAVPTPTPTPTPVEPVKIGELGDYSGPAASYGESMRKGHALALAEINAAGGIKSLKGAKLELIEVDHEWKPEVAKELAQRLIDRDKVSVLILGTPSGFGAMIGQLTDAANVAYYPSMVITSSLQKVGLKTMCRVSMTGYQLGVRSVDYVDFLATKYLNKKPTNLGVLYTDAEYPKDALDGMKYEAAKLGYNILIDMSYPLPLKDATTYITKIKAAKPDFLLICCQGGEAIMIDRAMMEQGYDPLKLGVAGAHADLAYLKNMGTAAENALTLLYSGRGISKDADTFFDNFKKVYGYDPDGFSAFAYQQLYVIAVAIEQAGSRDRAAIAEASRKLYYTKDTGPMVLNYKAIAFDETGQVPTELSNITGLQVQDGKYVSLWPEVGTMRFKDAWKAWKK